MQLIGHGKEENEMNLSLREQSDCPYNFVTDFSVLKGLRPFSSLGPFSFALVKLLDRVVFLIDISTDSN